MKINWNFVGGGGGEYGYFLELHILGWPRSVMYSHYFKQLGIV